MEGVQNILKFKRHWKPEAISRVASRKTSTLCAHLSCLSWDDVFSEGLFACL